MPLIGYRYKQTEKALYAGFILTSNLSAMTDANDF